LLIDKELEAISDRKEETIQLSNKAILITGASRGLGRALALDLVRAGARTALAARDRAGLEETAALCRRQTPAAETLIIVVDVTQSADCAATVQQTVAAFGGLDVLVVNAGMSMWAPFDAISDLFLFEKLIAVNYLAGVYCVHAALPHLVQSRGLIVNISTAQAWTGMPNHTGYSASKAAFQIFLDALSMEQKDRVRMLGVYPGWIRGTELREHALGADGQPLQEARRSHSSESVSAEECSAAIVRAMERDKRNIFIPAKLRLLYMLRPLAFPLIRRILSGAVRSQEQRHD
jgi:NAD(P)-dependent dehydrogenase (short-subunit alcohol dehydrogenase family)